MLFVTNYKVLISEQKVFFSKARDFKIDKIVIFLMNFFLED
jgi:hypothetical protein